MSKCPGKFIVFEGGEGSGKTTQIKLLEHKLRQHGFIPFVTKEPGGGGPIAEKIRDILKNPENVAMTPEAELFLFLAARAQHVRGTLIPRLERGEVVLCDRFYGSTLAYQHFGRGLFNLDEIKKINRFATGGLEPDLTILLDVDPKCGLARKGEARKNDRFDCENIDFHNKVRQGYLTISKLKEHWAIVNADQNEKEVFRNIWAEVSKLLNV
ncbi:MAG: dTMP kinase [Parcubacteria group bacterium]